MEAKYLNGHWSVTGKTGKSLSKLLVGREIAKNGRVLPLFHEETGSDLRIFVV